MYVYVEMDGSRERVGEMKARKEGRRGSTAGFGQMRTRRMQNLGPLKFARTGVNG